MAYAKTWTMAWNTVPTSQDTMQHLCQSYWIQLKEFLVNSLGWSVISSSDGTTFNSSGDNWGTTLSNINWNSGAAARSHITLKSPEGIVSGLNGSYLGDQSRLWITLEALGSSSTSYHMGQQTIHKTAPTGGSTTVIPTSTNSIILGSSNMLPSTVFVSKFHFMGVSTGENIGGVLKGKGAFYALVSNTTTLGFYNLLTISPITGYRQNSGLDYPYNVFGKFTYNTNINTCINGLGAANNSFFSTCNTWNSDGSISAACHGYVPTAPITTLALGVGTLEGNAGGLTGANTNSDIIVYNDSGAKGFNYGILADVSYSGSNITTLSVDSSGTINYCFVRGTASGGVWFPSNVQVVF